VNLIDAIRSRRSVPRLAHPAPSDEVLCDLMAAAATAPDHGLLRPWRLLVIRGKARELLGAAFAAGLSTADDAVRARAAAKPLRAPLLLAVVFTPRPSVKVPDWEQLASTVAVVHNLALLLHGGGWGAMWRTGEPSRSETVRRLLAVTAAEQLLGWLYVGTPEPSVRLPPRPVIDIRAKIGVLGEDGSVIAIGPMAAEPAPVRPGTDRGQADGSWPPAEPVSALRTAHGPRG
jgi:nitroreductase